MSTSDDFQKTLMSQVPLLVRVFVIAPIVVSITSVALGFISMTFYFLQSGFNFLNYTTAVDIAATGSAIMLFWLLPLVFIICVISLPFLLAIWLLKDRNDDTEVTSDPVSGVVSQISRLVVLACAALVSVFLIVPGVSFWAATVPLPNNDAVDHGESGNRTYGEIILKTSNYFVMRSTASFAYDPNFSGGGASGDDPDTRTPIVAELVVIRRDSVLEEYLYVTAWQDQVFQDSFTARFRYEDAPVSRIYRILKAPFR